MTIKQDEVSQTHRMNTAPTETSTASPGGKFCYKCNADLTGQRRYKDEQGYYCPMCARAMDKVETAREKKDDDEGLVKCPSCRRKLKPAAFRLYHGKPMCKQCAMAREDMPGLKVAKVELRHHAAHDKKRLIVLGAVAGVLVLISLLSFFGIIGK